MRGFINKTTNRKKIKNILTTFLHHELISGSFYVFLGTTLSSFLAFILNVYFARKLTYQDYGVFAALLSLVTLLTIPSQSLSAIIVRYATVFFTKKEEMRAGALYVKSFKHLLVFSLILNILAVLCFPFISSFLKITDIRLIIIVAISVAVFYFATLNVAFLQSLLKFRLLGFIYSLAGVGKLISGIILVVMGFKVYGAILATLIFSLIDFIFSIFPLKSIIEKAGKEVNIGIKDLTIYAVPTSIAIFSLASFISTDVLLVKHFFSSTEAGFYGGLSLVGKVIFYFTGPIAIAMFPLIVKRHAGQENFKNLFFISLIIVTIPSVIITLIYFVYPDFTIKIFLGGREYLSIAPYLGLFGIFLTIYSINNVFVNFFLSIKKTDVSLFPLITAIMQIILIYVFHDNFYQIILISILTSLLLLFLLVLYYLRIFGIAKNLTIHSN